MTILLLVSSWSFANANQTSKTDSTEHKLDLFPAIVIKSTPLKLIAPFNPAFEFTVEQFISQNLSLQIMAGRYIDPDWYKEESNYFRNLSGYRGAIELRIFHKNLVHLGSYVAVELDHQEKEFDINYITYDQFTERNLTAPRARYANQFRVHRRVTSLSTKLGIQRSYGRITLDCYIGLGLRSRTVFHTGANSKNVVSPNSRHPHILLGQMTKRNDISIALPLNLRVGYRFG